MATPISYPPVSTQPLAVEKPETPGSDNKASGDSSQVYGYFAGRSVNNRALVFLGTFLSAGLMLGVPVGYSIAADFVDDSDLRIEKVYDTLLKVFLGASAGLLSMCIAGYPAGKIAVCIYDRQVVQNEPNLRIFSAAEYNLEVFPSEQLTRSRPYSPQLSVIYEEVEAEIPV